MTHVQYNDIRYTGNCDGAADGSLLCHCEGGQVVLAVRHVREGHHRPGGAGHWRRIWYWSSHVSQVSHRVYCIIVFGMFNEYFQVCQIRGYCGYVGH